MTDETEHFGLYILSSLLLAIAVSICMIFSVQIVTRGYVSIGGYSLFHVVTGSMEPTIPTGSVLISQKTDIEQIKLNDIVCYRTRVTEIAGSIVTHRVVSIQTDESGVIYLETRGDANLSSDPYYVDETNLVGRVIWYGGKGSVWNDMLSFLSGKIGFLACIVIPILLIAGGILQGSVRSLRKEMAELRRELYENKKKEELLPGYTTLTYADYEAIYESLRSSLLEELNGTTESNESTGE